MIVGLSKTALPGINTISIAIFAAVLPAKASTGALLLVLIVGDICALWSYRRHADWPTPARGLWHADWPTPAHSMPGECILGPRC